MSRNTGHANILCLTCENNDTDKSMQTEVYFFFLLFGFFCEVKKKNGCHRCETEELRQSQRLNFEETGSKKLFEACRCFHILKEINICVHFDSDYTVQLQINNHNHKRPWDWFSVGLSFFLFDRFGYCSFRVLKWLCCLVCHECMCLCAPLSLCWGHSNFIGVNELCTLFEVCVRVILWHYID